MVLTTGSSKVPAEVWAMQAVPRLYVFYAPVQVQIWADCLDGRGCHVYKVSRLGSLTPSKLAIGVIASRAWKFREEGARA